MVEILTTPDSTSAMKELLRIVDSAEWTEQSQDWLKRYVGSRPTSKRMSIHRPGIGVTEMSVSARFMDDPENRGHKVPHFSMTCKLEPGLKAVIKDLPEWQRTHRSRKISLAFSRGQYFELARRATATRNKMDILKRLAIPDDQSRVTSIIQAEAFKKGAKVDPEYLMKYIKEHETSSVFAGTKWPMLGDPHDFKREWQQLLDYHLAVCDAIIDDEMFGKMPNFALNLGSRQRYNGQPVEADPDSWTHQGFIERSRVVLYHPALSSWFAFLPKEAKPTYYKDTVLNALDYLNIETVGEYISPLWAGGKVYSRVANAMQGGDPITLGLGDDYNVIDSDGVLHAVDGSTWDSFAGVICGRGHYWSSTYFGGHNSVPSGVVDTTTKDQLAMAHLVNERQKITGRMIDKMEGNDSYLLPGVAEFQPADSDASFVLGLTYGTPKGVEFPALCGVKLMEDSADTFRPLQEGRTITQTRLDDENALLSHQNAFYGLTIDNESLLTVMAGIDPEDWISPGTLLRRTIEFEGVEEELL